MKRATGYLAANFVKMSSRVIYRILIVVSVLFCQFSNEFILVGLCFISPAIPYHWLHFTFYSLSGLSFGHSLHQ